MEKNTSRFSLFANRVSDLSGRWMAFCLAVGSVLTGLATGYIFGYADNWKEWVALYMSAVTFLLVFLIQHSQNRATMALHLKLDELIRATHGAHTSLLKVEDLSDNEMNRLSDTYKDLADEARGHVSQGRSDIHAPAMDIASPKKNGG